MFKPTTILFTWLYFAIGSQGLAQSDYVVTIQGDTIRGAVKYLSFGVSKNVQVITESKKKTVYSLFQTKAFKLKNDVYQPVRTSTGYDFMKLLKGGYLSLYAFQPPNQTTWDGRYLLKRDGDGMEVPNIGFKKIISKYLSDCPEIESGFESKEFSKNKIELVVDQYNACIQANTENFKQEQLNNKQKSEKVSSWTELENAIKNGNDFEGRANALDMVAEVKSKIDRNEKVPNFLTDGLKGILKDQPTYTEILNRALAELK